MTNTPLTYREIVSIGRRLASMSRAEIHGIELELGEYASDEARSPREKQAFDLIVGVLAQAGR
jgi:hypothetical protein